jgi:uncharacterized protein YecT (DUF1311 family)
MRTLLFSAMIVLALSCDKPAPTAADECMGASTTSDRDRCVSRQIELLQRQLSAAIDSAKRLAPNVDAVDSAQSAWLRYRKAQCEAEASTIAPSPVPRCWFTLTVARVNELSHMYRNE